MTDCDLTLGWGSGWGYGAWGGGEEVDLRLIAVEPVRDNVVRLAFNTAIKFTGILDPQDGSNPKRYDVRADPTTTGYDGLPARGVSVVKAEPALVEGAQGRLVDVTVDRPFSPYPTVYRASVNNLVAAGSGLLLNPCFATFLFRGLYRRLQPPTPELVVPSRDIANPNTLSALLDPLPNLNLNQLGIIPVDDQGDYGFDEGLTNLKKRIIRRMVTRKGSFAFMPEYGVGIPQQIKRLNTASGRQGLASEAQRQIAQEPEVERCIVNAFQDKQNPNLVIFRVVVKTKGNSQSVAFGVPFAISS